MWVVNAKALRNVNYVSQGTPKIAFDKLGSTDGSQNFTKNEVSYFKGQQQILTLSENT